MMRRVWLLGIILASFLAVRAEAQVPVPGCLNGSPCVAVQAFTPVASTTLSVSNVSSSVAFPSSGSGLNLLVVNGGTVVAYYAVGNSSIVATTANASIDPGQTIVIPQGTWTTIAAITASGTTTLTIKSGTGQPNIIYQGSAPPAGTVNVAPGSITYPAPATGTIGTSSATIVPTPGVQFTKICNTAPSGSGNLWLNPSGAAAVAAAGDEAPAGGGCFIYNGAVTNANGNIITAISDNGTVAYSVTVGN